ncbi:MAG: ABC transporter ATP-binding protein [Planctomycetaceae bacterium]|nr:ABC transporter ATP-binding protein [Planctomycetota bacterium]NUN52767.1 ABC transporter ATP-binding protein [Planctomycetaceae bacterium]
MRAPAVSIRGLRKTYRGAPPGAPPAVDGLDLSVAAGSCFGLLGPNGAGKTTTIRILCAASPRDAGEVAVLGVDPALEPRVLKGRIGVVPQLDNLDPDFSVLRNLLVYARYFGIPAPRARERAAELLRFVRLEDRSGDPVEELSGGLRRRLVIARALLHDPELLVLDEPTTGLDPQSRRVLWDRVRELRRGGKTILLTTHYMEEAEALCDRVAIVDRGRVLVDGAPADLVRTHARRSVVELRGESAALASLAAPPDEVDRLEDRTVIYSDDGETLYHKMIQSAPGADAHLRRATLEDVFLRLTGRGLRE